MKVSSYALLLLTMALYLAPAAECFGQSAALAAQDATDLPPPIDLGEGNLGAGDITFQQSGCCSSCGSGCCGGGWIGGAEYLYVRTHFSEACAFATVNDSLSAGGLVRTVRATELDFDYDSSFRAFVGYDLGSCSDIQFTYWYFDTDTAVGGAPGAGQIVVDPFGNMALPGMRIDTSAAVSMDVFDIDYIKRLSFCQHKLGLKLAAGTRFVDIEQSYGSLVSAAGAPLSIGFFTADFQGFGPHFSIEGRTWCGSQLSLLGKIGGAILIGDYQIASGVTIPGVVSGAQFAERTRAVPVLESELGVSWRLRQNLTLSAGWMFQAWFNMGTSGGTFDGERLPVAPVDTAFGGADDSDIMSFDGLFVRAEARF